MIADLKERLEKIQRLAGDALAQCEELSVAIDDDDDYDEEDIRQTFDNACDNINEFVSELAAAANEIP